MAEYIDKTALVERLTDLFYWCGDIRKKGLEQAICIIHDQPIENVAPVKHGKWEKRKLPDKEMKWWFCSSCNHKAYTDGFVFELFDYCPFCGAKMEGRVVKE